MADFPNSVVNFTTKQNRTGVVYDETKTKVVFAEDFNLERDEIEAIEDSLINADGELNCPQTIRVDLSSAQILNSFSNPIELIPAPAVGKVIEVLNVTTYLRFESTAYVCAGLPFIKIDGGTAMFKVNGLTSSSNNISDCVREVCTLSSNKPLIFYSTVSNPTTGDSRLLLFITYKIIKL
jgi:hypothetical protein